MSNLYTLVDRQGEIVGIFESAELLAAFARRMFSSDDYESAYGDDYYSSNVPTAYMTGTNGEAPSFEERGNIFERGSYNDKVMEIVKRVEIEPQTGEISEYEFPKTYRDTVQRVFAKSQEEAQLVLDTFLEERFVSVIAVQERLAEEWNVPWYAIRDAVALIELSGVRKQAMIGAIDLVEGASLPTKHTDFMAWAKEDPVKARWFATRIFNINSRFGYTND